MNSHDRIPEIVDMRFKIDLTHLNKASILKKTQVKRRAN